MGVENADLLLIKSVEELSPGEEGLCSYVINTLWDPDLVIVEQSMDIFGPMGNPSVRRDMLRRSVENGTSFLILAKSLSDVRDICSHVGIMYSGRIVEEGETLDIVSDPKHPLTISMNAVEDMLNTGKRDESYRSYLQERPPDPELLPAGCYFEPRCKFSLDMCSTRRPVLSFTGSHKVACFLYSEKYEAPA
jgi:oligopeptide/dipeptide ABC transporter, ATP-binding protein, C-terminal domain